MFNESICHSSSSSSSSKGSKAEILPATAASAAYELVQASQALQAVQALQHLDPAAAAAAVQASPAEDLTQDPALLIKLPDCPKLGPIQLPPFEFEDHPYHPSYAFKAELQADFAKTIQVSNLQPFMFSSGPIFLQTKCYQKVQQQQHVSQQQPQQHASELYAMDYESLAAAGQPGSGGGPSTGNFHPASALHFGHFAPQFSTQVQTKYSIIVL